MGIVLSTALPTIYAGLQDDYLRGPACVCLQSLAKKGMDPYQKILLVQSIELVTRILALPLDRITTAGGQGGGGAAYDDDNDDEGPSTSFSLELCELLNVLLLELLGCWAVYEDGTSSSGATSSGLGAGGISVGIGGGNGGSGNGSGGDLTAVAPVVSGMLRALLPVAMSLFGRSGGSGGGGAAGDHESAEALGPALSKLVDRIARQKTRGFVHRDGDTGSDGSGGADGDYFYSSRFVQPLLRAIYEQMQYQPDFDFDAEDEDDAAVIEV